MPVHREFREFRESEVILGRREILAVKVPKEIRDRQVQSVIPDQPGL